MARKAAVETGRHSSFEVVRRWLWIWTGLSLAAAAALLGWHNLDAMLVRDSRFTLAAPEDAGEESSSLRISGVQFASRDAVQSVFARDFGRSVYLIPIEERRRALLAVNWVRDARVSRIWPDKLDVLITEREPVAFLHLASDGSEAAPAQTLVDAEGVILRQQSASKFSLPVLTGIRTAQGLDERRVRVRRMLRLMEAVGPHAGRLSEVDVGDPDNLRVTIQLQNRAIVLILGNKRFRERLENFEINYPEIRRRAPDETIFDLRLDDRIIAIPGGQDGG